MSFYVIAEELSKEDHNSHANTGVDVRIYLDDILPVFTSEQTLWEFVESWHSAQDPIRATPLVVDPLELASMVKKFEATEGLNWLVFDPKVRPSGFWILQNKPMSASYYWRYILERARGVKRLMAEVREQLRDEFPSSEELDKAAALLVALQAGIVNADARARTEEHVVEDNS